MQSAEGIVSLRKEIEVLEHVTSLSDAEKEAQRAAPPPPELLAQLQGVAAGLRKSSMSMSLQSQAQGQREILREGVFRPSHILPTLTVEQQGELEVAELLKRRQSRDEETGALTEHDAPEDESLRRVRR